MTITTLSNPNQGSIYDLSFGGEVPSGRRRRASSAGPGTCSPGNVLKWIYAETQSGTFWNTISRNVTMCALTSSRLDDFSDIVTYVSTVMITILFLVGRGKLGIFWGGSFYPSNTLDRTLQGGVWPPFQTLPSVVKNTIPPSLVIKQNSLHFPSLGVNILFNCSDLGIHLCTTWQLFNFKTKLGGEICSSDQINMQKGHCKWEYILWKSQSLQNTEATLCLSFSLILMNESNRVCIERIYAVSSHLIQLSKCSPI